MHHDQVLFDIPNTLLGCVQSAHRNGYTSLVFAEFVVRSKKYKDVIDECRKLKIDIYYANAPDFVRHKLD